MGISKHYTAKHTFGRSRLVQFITGNVLKYLWQIQFSNAQGALKKCT